MKGCAAIFYLLPSLGMASELRELTQAPKTLHIGNITLRRVDEPIVEEVNKELQELNDNMRGVLELSQMFSQYLGEQGDGLAKVEKNVEEVEETVDDAVAQLEHASDLALTHASTVSTLQHALAGGAGLVCGGVVAGVSAVFAPVGIAIGAGVGIGAIAFGGTEIGLHKDAIAAWFSNQIDEVEFPLLSKLFKPEGPKEHNVRLLINGVHIDVPRREQD